MLDGFMRTLDMRSERPLMTSVPALALAREAVVAQRRIVVALHEASVDNDGVRRDKRALERDDGRKQSVDQQADKDVLNANSDRTRQAAKAEEGDLVKETGRLDILV